MKRKKFYILITLLITIIILSTAAICNQCGVAPSTTTEKAGVESTETTETGTATAEIISESIASAAETTAASAATTATTNEASTYKVYHITSSSSGSGTISPLGDQSVIEGSDTTFTITPDNKYYLQSLIVDGKSLGAIKTYTFKKVSSDHTINAQFMENIFLKLAVTANLNQITSESGSIMPGWPPSASTGDQIWVGDEANKEQIKGFISYNITNLKGKTIKNATLTLNLDTKVGDTSGLGEYM